MSTDLVIFDIGNVLIEWQPERWYDARVGRPRREAMFAAVDLHGMNDRIDRGGDFRAIVYDTAEQYPEFREEIRMWHDNWIELASPAIDHSVRLLRALRANGVPVHALTNFGIGTFEIAERHYPFLSEFDMRHISGHMGRIKPDAEIYEMVERSCGAAPETILFTDDRVDNIAVARERGWKTHLFDGPGGWANRLVSAGLLRAGEAA